MDHARAAEFLRMSEAIESCLVELMRGGTWRKPWNVNNGGSLSWPEDLFSAVYWARVHAADWRIQFAEMATEIIARDDASAAEIAEYRVMRPPPETSYYLGAVKSGPQADDLVIGDTAHDVAAIVVEQFDWRLWPCIGDPFRDEHRLPEQARLGIAENLEYIEELAAQFDWNETELYRLLHRLRRERAKIAAVAPKPPALRDDTPSNGDIEIVRQAITEMSLRDPTRDAVAKHLRSSGRPMSNARIGKAMKTIRPSPSSPRDR